MHYYLMGLLLGLSLIMALGPQNLFIIQQAIKGRHHFLVASLCLACDVVLIVASVLGLSHLVLSYPGFKHALLVLGVLFLCVYGLSTLWRGLKKSRADIKLREPESLVKIIVLTLSFSLFNPQAIIDSVVMIGGSAGQLTHEQQLPFMLGTISASVIWFYGLTFSAHSYSDILIKKNSIRAIEIASGVLMLAFALNLMRSSYTQVSWV